MAVRERRRTARYYLKKARKKSKKGKKKIMHEKIKLNVFKKMTVKKYCSHLNHKVTGKFFIIVALHHHRHTSVTLYTKTAKKGEVLYFSTIYATRYNQPTVRFLP